MSNQPKGAPAPDDTDEDAPAKAEPAAKRWFERVRPGVLLGVAALTLAAGAYAAVAHFGLSVPSTPRPTPKSVFYYDLPEMVVNLSALEQRAQYLKLKIALEVDDQRVLRALDPVMPRVMDMFQLYLRELRTSDLDGSAGIFRLKEELQRRVNIELHPAKVNRVLFKEIIVQ